ncbi:lipoprotein [Pseudomonas taeanensis MS-3]|jgi:membrane-bound inhibitor of C-type lysozyme|uniref:Lipoprotein n=1 Tax=Pseudomonas taeanensis MS-3 TaxID=1395571 RepID=A0A0A1YKY0_9PSED|nr:MliC family protein [Pseudomonas taeanensis]KFX70560.1 lipoprotein [Pseudomonas taeanensis MS-3]
MNKAFHAAAVTLLLAGCAGQQQGADSWTRWVCDSQAEVLWRFADSAKEQVEVRLAADDRIYRLQQQPSASGALYSDGRLTFHSKGAQGLVYWTASDDLIGRGCKAP